MLLVAGNASYGCSNFQAELKASGRLKNSEAIRLRDEQFLKLTTFEDVPKYKVRLTNFQYCVKQSLWRGRADGHRGGVDVPPLGTGL